MALAKFWLLNGSKKKGKKSAKKVSKKAIRKSVAKKSVSKKAKTVIKKVVVKAKPKTKVVTKKVFVATPVRSLPVSLMSSLEKNKNIRGNKTMARRKRVKRSVAKATKKVRRIKRARKMTTALGKHRVVAFMDRAGALKTSRKSKIAKRNYKINPFKISTKGIVNNLKPAVVLSATSVGTIFGLNKVMPKIPYIDRINNSFVKAGIKVALGLIGQMGVKKFVKNSEIANGVLVGAIISALTDFIKISENTTTAGIKLNGVKVLGNPLSFGRPKTALANPNFQMNGIKINGKQNLSAIKFNKSYNADNTVSGCAERY